VREGHPRPRYCGAGLAVAAQLHAEDNVRDLINQSYFIFSTRELISFYNRLINRPSGQILITSRHVPCHLLDLFYLVYPSDLLIKSSAFSNPAALCTVHGICIDHLARMLTPPKTNTIILGKNPDNVLFRFVSGWLNSSK
jgi:hypothetical protein